MISLQLQVFVLHPIVAGLAFLTLVLLLCAPLSLTAASLFVTTLVALIIVRSSAASY